MRELADLLDVAQPHDVLVVGHGGVGTLWWCWLSDEPISRAHDQPGQGHRFTVDLTTRRPTSTWHPIDLAG